jgi:hypothetical protein
VRHQIHELCGRRAAGSTGQVRRRRRLASCLQAEPSPSREVSQREGGILLIRSRAASSCGSDMPGLPRGVQRLLIGALRC